jgi:hypothetical protein
MIAVHPSSKPAASVRARFGVTVAIVTGTYRIARRLQWHGARSNGKVAPGAASETVSEG